MSNRESNLGVRVGDTIIHCNGQFVIVDIRRDEGIEGVSLYIHAADPATVKRNETKSIEAEEIGGKITELIKKLTDRGIGGFGDIGK